MVQDRAILTMADQ